MILNGLILLFWIRFSFFYREEGVLDCGNSDDYWEISFKTLMYFVFGSSDVWLQMVILLLFLISLVVGLLIIFKPNFSFNRVFQPQSFYIICLFGLIAGIYIQKKLLNVNYPEDRTGLFFYVFFALSLTSLFDKLKPVFATTFALVFLLTSLCYFVTSFNLKTFSHYFYQVIPKEIYTYLEEEAKKSEQPFTLGGKINREMNFAFMNYRGGALVNHMDVSSEMTMNCDYYFALRREKPYYQFFYDELLFDEIWDRALLKRKEPLQHQTIFTNNNTPAYYSGDSEFFEFVRLGDSSLCGRNCMEADVKLFFKKVPKPFHAFLVFCVENKKGELVYYKRIPLNWLDDDLNGESREMKLTSGKIPDDFKSMYVYIWNINHQPIEFSLSSLKIEELHGKGVNFKIPEEFYPLVEKITQKPLL